MKTKSLVVLIIVSILFLGCQTTQPKIVDHLKLNNGKVLTIQVDGNIDSATHQMFLNYIKSDAEKHYKNSTKPYTFKFSSVK